MSNKRSSLRHSLNLSSVSKAFADVLKKDSSPTQRRRSSVAMDSAHKPSTLRPRNLNTSSALPKYRPKSALVDSSVKQISSPAPVRAGTRRRFSSEDEEEKVKHKHNDPNDKVTRPLSPLPHRASSKSAPTSSSPPKTPSKLTRLPAPSASKPSPSRPTKSAKTAPSTSAGGSAIPRPPSSTSSSSSLAPHTPKSHSVNASISLRRTAATPSNASPHSSSRDSPSPLARRTLRPTTTKLPAPSPSVGNMSHISENNEDTDEEDVELLLAPIAALGAPTPAMPKISRTRARTTAPQTPTRNQNLLPTRANLSYISPAPPTKSTPSSLRPPTTGRGGLSAGRGSILSWEQLASEASKTLGEDEIENMLSDIPAPFRSGAVSPTLSVPESPCLSTMDSPGGFGSISQVLLPDVTPSPAVHHGAGRYDSLAQEGGNSEGSTIVFLRLQLAAAENTAKERLYQMQAMEEELYNLKEAHRKPNEELESYASALEDKLRQIEGMRDQVVEEAVQKCRQAVWKEAEVKREAERRKREAATAARVAETHWMSVKDVAEVELDLVRGDRAVLTVLLAELDQMAQVLVT